MEQYLKKVEKYITILSYIIAGLIAIAIFWEFIGQYWYIDSMGKYEMHKHYYKLSK